MVDDINQLDKVLQVKKKLSHLKIVLLKTCKISVDESDDCYRWEDLESMDISDAESEYNQRLSQLCANDCCLFAFTSGTTGNSKVHSIF